MNFFRKNYLPDLTIYQDTDGKWFAEEPFNRWGEQRSFRQLEGGSYKVSSRGEPTKFDTLDALMVALYQYTCDIHLEAIKKEITYNKVNVRL